MKLVLLLSASLACVSGACLGGCRPSFDCFTKPTRKLPGKKCVFPFQYQGSIYHSCTNRDTINGEAWCGTVNDVRFTNDGRVLAGDVGDCDFQNSECPSPATNTGYCDHENDCYSNGNICDPAPTGNGCVCKNNQCKRSSGCGRLGLSTNLFNACSACNADDCEDEGVCTLEYLPGGSRCNGPQTPDDVCEEVNTNYPGNDIGRSSRQGSWETCKNHCSSSSGCTHWTFRNSDGECWLKSGISQKKTENGLVSGPWQCSGDNSEPCAGCPEDSPIDEEITFAALHATEYLDSGCGASLINVENAQKQVVAGTNFFLTLRVDIFGGQGCGERADRTRRICSNIVVFKPLPFACQTSDGCLEVTERSGISCYDV